MSVLLVVLVPVGAIVLMVLKALVVDQAKGEIQRFLRASLDATIDELPDELRTEWAEEWRADLAMHSSMPVTALGFVRGARRSARELVANPALAPAGVGSLASAAQTGSAVVEPKAIRWRVMFDTAVILSAVVTFIAAAAALIILAAGGDVAGGSGVTPLGAVAAFVGACALLVVVVGLGVAFEVARLSRRQR